MSNAYCPYCDKEIMIDDPDGYYVNEWEECECPHCEKVFLLCGEPIIEYSAETVEDGYGSRIRSAKGMIELYSKDLQGNPEKAEYAKMMIETYYQKDLDRAQKSLAEALEYNEKAGGRG